MPKLILFPRYGAIDVGEQEAQGHSNYFQARQQLQARHKKPMFCTCNYAFILFRKLFNAQDSSNKTKTTSFLFHSIILSFLNFLFLLFLISFWAAAPKGTKSCRTKGDFFASVRSLVPPDPLRPEICPLRPENCPPRLEICPLRP